MKEKGVAEKEKVIDSKKRKGDIDVDEVRCLVVS